MDKLTVGKDELLAKLKQNKAQHAERYAEALAGYRQTLEDRLGEVVRKLREEPGYAPNPSKVVAGLVKPEDHAADYDRAIRMVEASQGITVEFTGRDFDQFWDDDWDWQHSFRASYLSNTGPSRADRIRGL